MQALGPRQRAPEREKSTLSVVASRTRISESRRLASVVSAKANHRISTVLLVGMRRQLGQRLAHQVLCVDIFFISRANPRGILEGWQRILAALGVACLLVRTC